MESQSLILGLIIVALSALFVIWPFINFSQEDAPDRQKRLSTELGMLVEQREAVYATIRDLDFDYETGKLTEADYRGQRETWVERGVDILKAIDTLQQQTGDRVSAANGHDLAAPVEAKPVRDDLDSQIEAAVAARRRTV